MMKIPAQIGFPLSYFPNPNNHGQLIILGPQPMAATITFAHNDSLVNLLVIDHAGVGHPMQGVPLLYQPHDMAPDGGHCEYPAWMSVIDDDSEFATTGVGLTNDAGEPVGVRTNEVVSGVGVGLAAEGDGLAADGEARAPREVQTISLADIGTINASDLMLGDVTVDGAAPSAIEAGAGIPGYPEQSVAADTVEAAGSGSHSITPATGAFVGEGQ